MQRFKMVFNHSGPVYLQYFNQKNLQKNEQYKNISLNSPMIDRVHRAKPGCSACGKKVA